MAAPLSAYERLGAVLPAAVASALDLPSDAVVYAARRAKNVRAQLEVLLIDGGWSDAANRGGPRVMGTQTVLLRLRERALPEGDRRGEGQATRIASRLAVLRTALAGRPFQLSVAEQTDGNAGDFPDLRSVEVEDLGVTAPDAEGVSETTGTLRLRATFYGDGLALVGAGAGAAGGAP